MEAAHAVWVYNCQNTTLLEMLCHGLFTLDDSLWCSTKFNLKQDTLYAAKYWFNQEDLSQHDW